MFLSESERDQQLKEDIVIEFHYRGRSKFLGRKHLRWKYSSVTSQLHTRLDELTNKISECQLDEESKEVAVSIAGYVAKTHSSRSDINRCKEKLIFNNKNNGHNHDK